MDAIPAGTHPPAPKWRRRKGSRRDSVRDAPSGEKKAPAAVFGENGRSGINFRNLDAGRISQKYITNFMRGGSAAETDDFVADFFAGMGEEAVRSYLLRQYVVTSAVLCAIAFLEELGLSLSYHSVPLPHAGTSRCSPSRRASA